MAEEKVFLGRCYAASSCTERQGHHTSLFDTCDLAEIEAPNTLAKDWLLLSAHKAAAWQVNADESICARHNSGHSVTVRSVPVLPILPVLCC